MWSGGVDSTAVLTRYLKQTNYDIIALHFNQSVSNNQSRNVKELEAVNAIYPELLKIRLFKKIIVNVDFNTFLICRDMAILPAMAAPIAYSHGCGKIILGYVADAREHDIQVHHIAFTNSQLNGMVTKYANLNGWNWKPKFEKAKDGIFDTKENYIASIENYFEKTWFCRNPQITDQGEIGCGKCHTCRHVLFSLKNRYLKQKYHVVPQ